MTHQSSNYSKRYKSVLKRDKEDDDYGRRRNRSRSPNRRRRRSRSRSYSRSKSDIRRRRSSRSKSRSYSRNIKRRHRDRSRSDSRSDRKRRHRSRTPPTVKNSSPVRKNEILKSSNDEKPTKSKSINHCSNQNNDEKVQSQLLDESKKIDNTDITSKQGTPTEANELVIENVKLPDYPHKISTESRVVGAYYNLDVDEPIDKERIHKEIEEKLRFELAKEGKVYPPPKPEASHPVFANDGSFLEIFKKMQEQNNQMKFTTQIDDQSFPTTTVSSSVQYARTSNTTPVSVPLPVLGRRRGGKILKTGIVAKPKALTENENGDPKDFWSIYLREVNKYKNAACETDGQTRPLVK